MIPLIPSPSPRLLSHSEYIGGMRFRESGYIENSLTRPFPISDNPPAARKGLKERKGKGGNFISTRVSSQEEKTSSSRLHSMSSRRRRRRDNLSALTASRESKRRKRSQIFFSIQMRSVKAFFLNRERVIRAEGSGRSRQLVEP